MDDVKTLVRIDLDSKTLDEIDRRSLARGISRSAYVALLVEQEPKHQQELEAEYIRGYDNGYAAAERSEEYD